MAKYTFTVGEKLTAARTNNFCQEGEVTNSSLSTTAGEPGGAWEAFTPVIVTGTAATKAGRYLQVGKTVHFTMSITWGSGDNFTDLVVELPVAPHASVDGSSFTVLMFDGLLPYIGCASIISDDLYVFAARDSSANVYIDAVRPTTAIPFTWAASDVIRISGTYEAA
jgi:hypothetical protein